MAQYQHIAEAVEARYGSGRNAEQIFDANREEALGEFFGKWVIETAHRYGWCSEDPKHVYYVRQSGTISYQIRKLVFVFRKSPADQSQMPSRATLATAREIDDVIKLIASGPARDISVRVRELSERKPMFFKSFSDEVARYAVDKTDAD